ncbi:unnamed protein product [Prorocentrum cordatum]|uniref:Uncharacterized protein n=1 Tax=Prorocentrum cordatum TaxID=2364126 RepID=A0ABN9RYT5_9DINO|nr:unnamed protein product [Polarella glacialis]
MFVGGTSAFRVHLRTGRGRRWQKAGHMFFSATPALSEAEAEDPACLPTGAAAGPPQCARGHGGRGAGVGARGLGSRAPEPPPLQARWDEGRRAGRLCRESVRRAGAAALAIASLVNPVIA